MSYDNSNKGALFKNEKQNERQPDLRGPVNIDGKEYELSAWVKNSEKAGKYYSLAVQPRKVNGGSLKAKESDNDEPMPF
jgi:hypothetical protein